jgi:hypothetical protein
MAHAARHLPDGKTPDGFGIKVDDSYLKLHPDPLGPQHDEREPGYLGDRFKWDEGLREVKDEAILHSTVLERFAAEGGVQHYYQQMPCRPENLRSHTKVKKYYGPEASTSNQSEITPCPAPSQPDPATETAAQAPRIQRLASLS